MEEVWRNVLALGHYPEEHTKMERRTFQWYAASVSGQILSDNILKMLEIKLNT